MTALQLVCLLAVSVSLTLQHGSHARDSSEPSLTLPAPDAATGGHKPRQTVSSPDADDAPHLTSSVSKSKTKSIIEDKRDKNDQFSNEYFRDSVSGDPKIEELTDLLVRSIDSGLGEHNTASLIDEKLEAVLSDHETVNKQVQQLETVPVVYETLTQQVQQSGPDPSDHETASLLGQQSDPVPLDYQSAGLLGRPSDPHALDQQPPVLLAALEDLLEAGKWTQCSWIVVTDPWQPLPLLREMAGSVAATVLSPGADRLPRLSTTTCQIVVADTRTQELTGASLGVLSMIELFRQPDTLVVGVGGLEDGTGSQQAEPFFDHLQLSNTVHAFFIVEESEGSLLRLYRRCMYCDGGEPGVLLASTYSSSSSRGGWQHGAEALFPDEMTNFNGHKFRIVTLDWYPMVKIEGGTPDTGGGVVQPKDSLDVRMLHAISKNLNFTFEMRTPWDLQWGSDDKESGNWTGIIGTLQYEKADFSMMVSWIYERLSVMEYTSSYSDEPLIIATMKAQDLPRFMALARPFTGSLWGLVVASSFAFGLLLYVLTFAWDSAVANNDSSKDATSLSVQLAMLQSWRVLLQNPLEVQPTNNTIRVLLGFWWMFCMLVSINYKSSLVAHLSVPGVSKPLDTLEEFVKADGWTIGFEATYGSGWLWVINNENPIVKKAASVMQVMSFDDNMNAVLKGNHMFLTWKYYIRMQIGRRLTDDTGYTPIHLSTEEYFNYNRYGWGVRRGAPFRRRLELSIQRLIHAGLIKYWMDDLLELTFGDEEVNEEEKFVLPEAGGRDQGGQVVLGLTHLQAAFYILGLGCGLGALVFAAETWAARRLGRPDK